MNDREHDRWAAVADRFWAALDEGNVAVAMACCLPSVTTWHNFDRTFLNAADAERSLRTFVSVTVERTTTEVRRDFFHGGFVQQHVLVIRTKPGGPQTAWPVCVLMRFHEGKVASITEYIDRAASFDPATTADSSTSARA